jgi:hypothetical protein
MSTCLGYSVITEQNCEGSSDCNNIIGCRQYSLSSPPETNFNMHKEIDYEHYRGMKRESYATGSWPCRGQNTCNYFDKTNPILSDYVRHMDILALPPN